MTIDELSERIIRWRKEVPTQHSMLVGISGIDASGKGFVAKRLAEAIRQKGLTVANINADGWLNLPETRFDPSRPAENFYEKALRLDEMFEKLILPLKKFRSVDLGADFAEETSTEFRPHRYKFEDIDVILLEGIFLFKHRYRNYFDLRIWIQCTFETAIKRAISRSQEGLSTAETVKAYQAIFFPAQRLHLELDNPQGSADIVFQNDFHPKS